MKHLTTALTKAAIQFGVELSQARIASYLESLSGAGLPESSLVAAVNGARLTSDFFPSAAAILKAAGADAKSETAAAWTEALRIAGLGRDANRNEAATPAIREAVRLCGGWDAIGRTATDRMHFVERKFSEVYAAAGVDTLGVACEATAEMRRLQ